MEIHEAAARIVTTESLAEKLAPLPPNLTDEHPDRLPAPGAPGRAPELSIVPGKQARVPSLAGMADPTQRGRILHALANHELQAAELFAWALLAYPGAPPAFRRGLLAILDDEQRHTRMYVARTEAHGIRFGDYPVSGYFWNKAHELTSPLRFICAMSLTFENANLDHTLELAAAAREAGDEKTAAVINRVHRDEIEHVRFGRRWLEHFKRPGQRLWEAYLENLVEPLHPGRASGEEMDPAARRAAGLPDDFIAGLERARALTGPGGHRLDRPGAPDRSRRR